MNRLVRYIKSISFRLRWFFMSPEERYACLWTRTKKLGDFGYEVWNTGAGTSK